MAFIGNIDGVLDSSCGKVFNDLSETSKISDRLFGGELGAPKNNKKAEIDTVMQMMTDGKSIAETKAMLQEMTYWKWELAEEPQFGDSDDNIKPRRLRIRDNTAKRHEEKAIRESFQLLVDTAKIVDAHAIHGIIMTANKLNAEHGYRYSSYIDELDEVLRMKTTPQMHIDRIIVIHDNENVKIEK